MAQTVKRLHPMQKTRVQSLGREGPPEKEMAIHSSTLAWKIPWTEKPGRLQPMGSQRIGHDFTFTFLSHLFLLLYLLPSETDPQNIAMFYAKESSAYILF